MAEPQIAAEDQQDGISVIVSAAEQEEAHVTERETFDDQQIIAAWYDQTAGVDRRRSEIMAVRSFNNWIKACLLSLAPRNGYFFDMGSGKGGDIGKWAVQNPRYLVFADLTRSSLEEAQRRFNTVIVRSKLCRNVAEAGPSDDRRGALSDQILYSGVCAADFLWTDFSRDAIPLHFRPALSSPGQLRPFFDFASCQFSIHYAFRGKTEALRAFHNAADLLKPGALFVCTFPDSETILERVLEVERDSLYQEALAKAEEVARLEGRTPTRAEIRATVARDLPTGSRISLIPRSIPGDSEDKPSFDPGRFGLEKGCTPAIGNQLYRILFQELPAGLLSLDLPLFGVRYHFWLRESVNADEYLVRPEALKLLAEACNLEMVHTETFAGFHHHLQQNSNIYSTRQIEAFKRLQRERRLRDPREIGVDQWEAITLYRFAIFRRRAATDVPFQAIELKLPAPGYRVESDIVRIMSQEQADALRGSVAVMESDDDFVGSQDEDGF